MHAKSSAKSQMQNYKYSHLVHVRTSSSISRCEIGNASEPLRVTLFYENPDRHHHRSLTFSYMIVASPRTGQPQKREQEHRDYKTIEWAFRSKSPDKLAFLTLCDLALNPPFLGGKIIKLGKFCFIKTKFEPNLLCFSK